MAIRHAGDCSIYAANSVICDCGAFRKAIRGDMDGLTEYELDAMAKHFRIAEPGLLHGDVLTINEEEEQ
jgi:hypothetical protein